MKMNLGRSHRDGRARLANRIPGQPGVGDVFILSVDSTHPRTDRSIDCNFLSLGAPFWFNMPSQLSSLKPVS